MYLASIEFYNFNLIVNKYEIQNAIPCSDDALIYCSDGVRSLSECHHEYIMSRAKNDKM